MRKIAQDNIYKLIEKKSGLTSSEISKKLNLGMSSTTTGLKKLREQGYIKGVKDTSRNGQPMKYYTEENYRKVFKVKGIK